MSVGRLGHVCTPQRLVQAWLCRPLEACLAHTFHPLSGCEHCEDSAGCEDRGRLRSRIRASSSDDPAEAKETWGIKAHTTRPGPSLALELTAPPPAGLTGAQSGGSHPSANLNPPVPKPRLARSQVLLPGIRSYYAAFKLLRVSPRTPPAAGIWFKTAV